MGQKVHPNIIRLGYSKDWTNNWFANKVEFAENTLLDIKIKKFLYKKIDKIILSKIIIEHRAEDVKILILSAKPGIIIGKDGTEVEKLKEQLMLFFKIKIDLSVCETPNLISNAQLISNNIATQLEKRILFKKIIQRYLFLLNKPNIKGIKIRLKGRINGAEIARTEWLRVGQIPLHTFRAYIDYGFAEAFTKSGIIGVKVWIYNLIKIEENVITTKENEI